MDRIHAYRSRPSVRVVPLSDPAAFDHQPGERRVVFSNRVIIVKDRLASSPSDRDGSV